MIALLICLSGGGYILYQNDQAKRAEIAREEAEKLAKEQEEARKAAEKRAALNKAFEDFLNGFLGNVYEAVGEYKKGRAVLNDLGKPANLRAPEYIEENARMAERTVLALQLQADDVMSLFQKADADVRVLIEQFEDEGRERVEKGWAEVRDENAEKFMAFFAMDQDVLMAQLKLIEFYNENRDVLDVDIENDRILFDDIAKQEEAAVLKGRVMEMRAMQRDVMQKADDGNGGAGR